MKCTILFTILITAASAFSSVAQRNHGPAMVERSAETIEQLAAHVAALDGEPNCGALPCLSFDAEEQYVSVSGEHAFVAPSKTDLRGPCPGLNAAANHGYLPRNGVASILQTMNGLEEAYGMAADLSSSLAALAVLFAGDMTTLTWSIGGPQGANPLNTALFGTARGISLAHNSYESDGSIGRYDSYLNGGDATSLDLDRFKTLYEVGMQNDRYTLDNVRPLLGTSIKKSVHENPYYFSAVFAGALVVPAAHNFVVTFFSNHSAAEPSGFMNSVMLKEFFAVTGDYPDFKYTPGYERIPTNWYRRPSSSQYNALAAIADVAVNPLRDPSSFRIGGNTNGTDSYVGADLTVLTGGAFTPTNLFKGNNFGCFVLQAQSMFLDTNLGISGVFGRGGVLAAEQLIAKWLQPLAAALACPDLTKAWDFSEMEDRYPGARYSPKTTR